MKFLIKNSDQLNKDTDNDKENVYKRITPTSRSLIAQTKVYEQRTFKGFDNRTFQEVRKKRLQMYDRQRTWPQALFICQLSKQTTRYDLYSTGNGVACDMLCREPQKRQKHFRRNQRHQQRAAGQARGILTYNGCPSCEKHYGFCRSKRTHHSYGKHGPKYPGVQKGGHT